MKNNQKLGIVLMVCSFLSACTAPSLEKGDIPSTPATEMVITTMQTIPSNMTVTDTTAAATAIDITIADTTSAPDRPIFPSIDPFTSETTSPSAPVTLPPGWDVGRPPLMEGERPPARLPLDQLVDINVDFEAAAYFYDYGTNTGDLLVWNFAADPACTDLYQDARATTAPILMHFRVNRIQDTTLDWVYSCQTPAGLFTLVEEASCVYRDDDGATYTTAGSWWPDWLTCLQSPLDYALPSEPIVPPELMERTGFCFYLGYVDKDSGELILTGGRLAALNPLFLRLVSKAEEMRALTFPPSGET